ncbi:hypothetical protein E2C01_101353 [Portunus trituberculatus]|uniref:Uncharacterized protein n=1 Tax=Portunus trituberculatus TaxID=210409 RepID=A0A5B7K5H6_PORTR|nr:hypothetical protein [Portunus trituberculatus]
MFPASSFSYVCLLNASNSH